MQIDDLEILFGQHPQIKAISDRLAKGDKHVLVSGLHASARALALSALKQALFIVLDNEEAARYLYSDLRSLTAGAVGPSQSDCKTQAGPAVGPSQSDCKNAGAVGPSQSDCKNAAL